MPSMRKIPQGTRPSSCGASSRAGAIRCTRLQGGPTPTEHLSLFLDMRLGIPLPFTGEFEVVIMIESVTEEMHGSDWVPDLEPTDREVFHHNATAAVAEHLCEAALTNTSHLRVS